jgi:hypothetical protein
LNRSVHQGSIPSGVGEPETMQYPLTVAVSIDP